MLCLVLQVTRALGISEWHGTQVGVVVTDLEELKTLQKSVGRTGCALSSRATIKELVAARHLALQNFRKSRDDKWLIDGGIVGKVSPLAHDYIPPGTALVRDLNTTQLFWGVRKLMEQYAAEHVRQAHETARGRRPGANRDPPSGPVWNSRGGLVLIKLLPVYDPSCFDIHDRLVDEAVPMVTRDVTNLIATAINLFETYGLSRPSSNGMWPIIGCAGTPPLWCEDGQLEPGTHPVAEHRHERSTCRVAYIETPTFEMTAETLTKSKVNVYKKGEEIVQNI